MQIKNLIMVKIGFFVFAVLFFLMGCAKNTPQIVKPAPTTSPKFTSTPDVRMTQNQPHVSPYIQVKVMEVEIRYLETEPQQVEIVIRGTLPDQCKYSFYSLENRSDQNVKVSLAGIHPNDNNCLQTEQSIEYVLLLGRDMPEKERGFSPGDYMLTVNDYQAGFSIE